MHTSSNATHQRVLEERSQPAADAIVVFESENKLESYVTNSKYDNKNYKDGKVKHTTHKVAF